MTKTTESTKETLETFKAKVKLQETKVHYRYAIVITAILTFLVGMVAGYFVSIGVITQASSRVVNSIELSVKDQK